MTDNLSVIAYFCMLAMSFFAIWFIHSGADKLGLLLIQWKINRKNKQNGQQSIIRCRDCDSNPAKVADWYIEYTKYWRWDYNWPKKYPVCYECLMDIMGDRFMGGGGPTSNDVLKIVPIHPENQRGFTLKEKKGGHKID